MPGAPSMPVPTMESLAIPAADETRVAPTLLAATLTSFSAAFRSDSATENVRSVWPDRPMFCTMTSTEIPAAPSGSKIAAATPGRSRTPTTVIFATLVSCAIPRTRWRSSMGTWATIIVPTPSSKLERPRHSLKARDDRALLIAKGLQDAVGLDVTDARRGVMLARADACLRSGQRHRRHAHPLQAHRDQGRGDGLAVGDEHVELAPRRLGVDALSQRYQPIRGVAHRGHDRDHLLTLLDGVGNAPADAADAGGRSDGCAAVLLDDHNVRNMPLSVILVTRARPRRGCASSIALAIRFACDGAQKAKTLGPAPQIAAPYAPAASATWITSSAHG